MTATKEYRVVCSGVDDPDAWPKYLGRIHTHTWRRAKLEHALSLVETLTADRSLKACRPFIVEERSVGLWVRSGQQQMGEVG